MKRDRLFSVVLCIILGNLAYYIWTAIGALIDNPTHYRIYFFLVADIVAIVGVFWYIRTYLKGRKLAKRQETKKDAQ